MPAPTRQLTGGVRTALSTTGIYDQLKQAISDGDLPEGSRLVETQLAERFSVSRTPIRQALLALEQDGIVIRSGRSLHVRQQSPAEIIELYEVREILEERAARLAAERRNEVDVVILNRLLEDMSGDISKDERHAINREFHTSMWRAAHQDVLFETLRRLYANSVQALNTTLTGPERWEATMAEHRGMVEAILGGDADKAADLVRNHLKTARDIRIRAILDRSRPD